MPPKKGKKGKKKKKAPKVDPNALTEVDKTFYELTIADLNRKLARLRSLTQELEEKNEQLQNDLAKLDEDRNDIIIYLKRMLQEKSDEIAELQERLTALEETRNEETESYEAKIEDLQNEYKQMHEQLTSEIKLLEGKLNSLEEFRIQRDELMKKFEEQEVAMEEQEKRHKTELYEMERKFIIAKDKLKKDMEARLLQLSADFQEATEYKIAATTHRVIRENIAINNELDSMLITHDRLHAENAEMKSRDKTLRQEAQLHEAEKKKALAHARSQLKIIERLTQEHGDMKDKLSKYLNMEKELSKTNLELQTTQQNVLFLKHQIRVLEQNVHALKCKELCTQTELNNVEAENGRLSSILAQAIYSIGEVLEMQAKITDEALRAAKRESLLTKLFTLLTESENVKARRPSLDTIGSISAMYERGDLGFVPKPITRRSSILTVRHMEAQTDASFEEYLAIGKVSSVSHSSVTLIQSIGESGASEMTFVEEESDVYFQEEATEEDSFDFDDMDLADFAGDDLKRKSLALRKSIANRKSIARKSISRKSTNFRKSSVKLELQSKSKEASLGSTGKSSVTSKDGDVDKRESKEAEPQSSASSLSASRKGSKRVSIVEMQQSSQGYIAESTTPEVGTSETTTPEITTSGATTPEPEEPNA